MSNYYHFKTIDSTSTYLKNNYKQYGNLTFVSADFQTEGHGRNNRKWISAKKENLLFSILIKDREIIDKYSSLSLYSAACVYEVLSRLNINDISIKWPNDVFVGDKKIAGILLEGISFSGNIEALVIGVGINVNSIKFDKDMKNTPTSILLETNKETDLEDLKKIIYDSFKLMINNIKEYDSYYLNIVRNNNYLKDKEVSVDINNHKEIVKVIDINEDNSLKVKKGNEYFNLYSGEVIINK